MDDFKLKGKLAFLISEGNELGAKLQSCSNVKHLGYSNKDSFPEVLKWRFSLLNIFKLRFGTNSDYYKEVYEYIGDESCLKDECVKQSVRETVGIVSSILEAIEEGFTDDLFYKKELLVFSNLLEQAVEFLDNGLNHAAGIYGRIVLETTIKEFGEKHGISEKKFDQLIIKLRKEGLIQKPFENSLRANYEIGSWAAHGKEEFSNLTKNQIKEYLDFIRDKVLTLE